MGRAMVEKIRIEVEADTDKATADIRTFAQRLRDELARSAEIARSAVNKSGKQFVEFGKSVGGSTLQLRALPQQLSQVAQQASVTGDFMSALAIQAFDIGAAFGGVGVAAGALAGFTIPVLVASFADASKEVDILEKEIDQLGEAASSAQDVLERLRLSTDELVETYGRGARIVREFSIAQAELVAGQIERRLRDQIGLVNTLSEEYTRATRGTIGNVAAIRRDFGVTTEQAKLLRSELTQLGNAKTFESQQEELGDILDLLDEMDVDLSKIPPDLNSALQEMISLGVETERVRTLMAELRAEAGGVTTGAPLFDQPFDTGELTRPETLPREERSRGGSRGSGRGEIEALIESLQTEQETIEQFRLEGLERLKEASEEELELIGGFNEAKLRLEEEYNRRRSELAQKGADSNTSIALGSFQTILSGLGQFNSKALKAAKIAGAAQALVSTFQGAAKALELPYPYNLAAAANVIAQGLGFISQIKGAGGGGGGGGGGGTATAQAAPPPPDPVQVSLSGINPDQLFTGAQFRSLLFDNLQAEAGDRGLQFVR